MAQRCPNTDAPGQPHDFRDTTIEYEARLLYCRACGETRPLSRSLVLESRIEEAAKARETVGAS